jgi:hypothetical protein
MKKHNTMKYSLILTLLLSMQATAQLIGVFGDERAGTTSMTFLKIAVGARAEGMGDAFVAVPGDASSLWWNPAGIGLKRQGELLLNHVEWPAGIAYEYLGFTWPVGRKHTVGIALASLHMDDMQRTTIYHPDGDGTFFNFGDELLQLSWAVNLTDHFTGGISVKYVRERLDDLTMSAPLLDMGTFYYTGFRDLTVAMSITNFGGVIRPAGSYQYQEEDGSMSDRRYKSFSPPTVFRLGSSMHVYQNDSVALLAAMQVTHPVDNRENYNLGLELDLFDHLQLRGGYKFHAEEESWTAGIGTVLDVGEYNMRLDWSYSDFGLFDYSQRLSLLIGF